MYRFLHALSHHYLAGMSLLNGTLGLGLICAAVIALGGSPLSRWWSVPLALLLGLPWVMNAVARRRYYVAFRPGDHREETSPLPPHDKIPVRVSGIFEVDRRWRSHTWLEGYFRSFPSREHAVIALFQPSTYGIWGQSDVRDDGMWYIFCQPAAIVGVQIGTVRFGRESLPAVALTHRLEMPGRLRRKTLRMVETTAYLGCQSEADAARLAADLLYDSQAPASRPQPLAQPRVPASGQMSET